ncbi:fructosamine kinase family protein [Spirulina sp. 06S082]|uniref:fructosamine kinase family protein n=1 Tax=Spirulina sp. 06S082 TaxID=3110248 RepID=UPI002B204061|nr:fructosamine kinase family protein [Spirulina sp. 06S082]MEA5468024.1 fructosamine kinase family protein [Spirulina sp. 06S082]
MWKEIAAKISEITGESFEITAHRSIGGGSINQSYCVSDRDRAYFVKINQANQIEMFAAEYMGLQQMYETQTIRIPQPLCYDIAGENSFIVMEWLEFGRGDSRAWELMGKHLANLHQSQGSDRFGWTRNNTIGSTPQMNPWSENWGQFFAEQRIGFQLRLAKRRGGKFPNTEQVVTRVKEILASWQPQPSLVHGDLWSGNAACTVDGEPVILDPATYWGDREVDLAMTELFGGFPAAFYRGYNQTWHLDRGYEGRKSLYNLYHVLNHFNLFGGGYESQASTTITRLLS